MPGTTEGTDPLIDRVDALIGGGYVGKEKAASVAAEVPESATRILGWLRVMAGAGDWRRFERFAGVAVHLHPDGLAEILLSALQPSAPSGQDTAGAPRVNTEDVVDMLGELRAPEAVGPISRLLRDKRESDAPFFAVCTKIIHSLAEIGTPDARDVLREVATGSWPKPLKWHAAEELGIEEELGFDEDEMPGGA
ncbi:HEAT repeat domain-containing protein [Streptomyces sp. NPDC090073]|uniref:HEAT repeat domain-containing protein n=1 Tax=Streptomyces sp. NPDC090073 TaxID=3365936 RepID=UPI00380D2576